MNYRCFQFPKLFDISKLKKKLKRASFLCRYFSLSQVNVIISVTPALRNRVVCSRSRRLIKKLQTGEYPSKDGKGVGRNCTENVPPESEVFEKHRRRLKWNSGSVESQSPRKIMAFDALNRK